jgi:hypothetical protein
VHLDRWKEIIPADAWPSRLSSSGVLWRKDVFAVAGNWLAGRENARAFLVTVCMWGTGPRGYGPARTLAALNADPDGAKLEHNLQALQATRPSEEELRTAYQRFNRASETHLYRLGPSFFTKVLYFAGYRRGTGGLQPLILDKQVAGRLPRSAGPAHARAWGWPSEDWIAYLRWAAQAAARPQFGGEPDAVEMALFSGKWVPDDH